jgi:hypothetical protein
MITEFVQHVAERWSAYLSGIVALGVLTMAILQTVKDLFPVRRMFQQRFLRTCFARKCSHGTSFEEAERDLLALATDGDKNAFYDLPIEQLCGQMSAAAQVVLDYPAAHSSLLQCLASQTPAGAVERLIAVKQSLRQAFETLKLSESAQDRADLESLADAKSHVMHQIQRSIDAFQISATYRWRLVFQIASFFVSFLVAYVATGPELWPWATRAFVALVAGFLAPVARDLQAKLQQVK